MSYEIIYDRRFLKIQSKFVPLFQYGSNNCFEMIYGSRGQIQIPEKNWSVFNYSKRGQYLFEENEIKELAKAYEDAENFKSRYKRFETGEFERWYISGMKNAKPLEDYLALGNRFYVMDYTDRNDQNKYAIRSTSELVETLKELEGRNLLLSFEERNLALPNRNSVSKEPVKMNHFFVVRKGDIILSKINKRALQIVRDPQCAKKFKTETAAKNYIEKYRHRLGAYGAFLVEQECYI